MEPRRRHGGGTARDERQRVHVDGDGAPIALRIDVRDSSAARWVGAGVLVATATLVTYYAVRLSKTDDCKNESCREGTQSLRGLGDGIMIVVVLGAEIPGSF